MSFSLKSTKKSGELFIHTFKYSDKEGSFLELRKAIYTCPQKFLVKDMSKY